MSESAAPPINITTAKTLHPASSDNPKNVVIASAMMPDHITQDIRKAPQAVMAGPLNLIFQGFIAGGEMQHKIGSQSPGPKSVLAQATNSYWDDRAIFFFTFEILIAFAAVPLVCGIVALARTELKIARKQAFSRSREWTAEGRTYRQPRRPGRKMTFRNACIAKCLATSGRTITSG